ncbi:alpha-hydroxy-acid oxidizing protein [Sphingomonas liriopis]|uniref:alpha-hydroxy-acid oxidizing protein n=1 Tax=Sphingomonas liriopis TaxID=2949094 RepID=UPI003BF5F139
MQAARGARRLEGGYPLLPVDGIRLPDRRGGRGHRTALLVQLYMIRDCGFMCDLMAKAKAEGCSALVFAVDSRCRDRVNATIDRVSRVPRTSAARRDARCRCWAVRAGPTTSACAAGRISSATSRPYSAKHRMGRLLRLGARQFRSDRLLA